jgi:hypothetical protein
MRQLHFAASLLATAMLAACGGTNGPVIDTGVARGTLYSNPPDVAAITLPNSTVVTKLDPLLFTAMLDAASPGLTQITGAPKCAITTYSMKYATVGGAKEATDASGAIMVPSGSDPACSGARPVLLYAHGTTVEKSFNMANVIGNAEATLVAAMYAAQGYIVVAPNYAGYHTSSLSYHPYLNAEQQANDMVDAMRAARKAFPVIGASEGKLLISGYSQGGHVAMATQRAMQLNYASEFTVTALAGMSGPYAMAFLGDAVFSGLVNAGGTVFMPMIATSWQKSYGGLYSSPSELYEDKYATGIESLIPSSTLTFTTLFTTGKLPALALFKTSSLPGAPSPAFAPFFGDDNLIKTSFRNAYLGDAVKNPCGANPVNPLSCTPENGFRKAGVKNDLRNYVPKVPVMMCGGNGDPTVFFNSTKLTEAYFLGNGMPAAALTVLDVDSAPTGATDPYAAAKVGFGMSKTAAINAAIAAKTDPVTAVASAYHGGLVPPFCNAAARGFFTAVLAR